MQNDLISRSALLVDWKNKLSQMGKWIDGGAPVDFRLVVNELEAAPAVDAVVVVRCRDCKWYRNYGRTSLLVDGENIKAGWCQRRIRYEEDYRMLPNDFCSYGERRAEDGK